MEDCKFEDLKESQLLILLALVYLHHTKKTEKEFITARIQKVCKEKFFTIIPNSTFNNHISTEKRRGLLRYGLIKTELNQANQNRHKIVMRRVQKVLLENKSKRIRLSNQKLLLRLVEIAAHVTYCLNHGRKKYMEQTSTEIYNTIKEYINTGRFQPHLLEVFPVKLT